MGRSSKLYNSDLAPTPSSKKNWGWFEIFNVWANDVQSLFGYTLAASLFLASGLNGWAVFAALILAGFFIMWLVNLSGKPSVKHGIPYPVFARVSMGVFGANFPAMARRSDRQPVDKPNVFPIHGAAPSHVIRCPPESKVCRADISFDSRRQD